jgi:hypothetical protein
MSPAVRQAEALFGLGDLHEQGYGLAAADGPQPWRSAGPVLKASFRSIQPGSNAR